MYQIKKEVYGAVWWLLEPMEEVFIFILSNCQTSMHTVKYDLPTGNFTGLSLFSAALQRQMTLSPLHLGSLRHFGLHLHLGSSCSLLCPVTSPQEPSLFWPFTTEGLVLLTAILMVALSSVFFLPSWEFLVGFHELWLGHGADRTALASPRCLYAHFSNSSSTTTWSFWEMGTCPGRCHSTGWYWQLRSLCTFCSLLAFTVTVLFSLCCCSVQFQEKLLVGWLPWGTSVHLIAFYGCWA